MLSVSCEEDDEYSIRQGEIISQVTTGEVSVTAISAEVQGVVKDLTQVVASSYEVGVVYGTTEDPTASGTKQVGSIDEQGNLTATLSGLTTGQTYYYATYVTLQKKLTKYGEVKSFVATQARVETVEAADIAATQALFAANYTGTEGIDYEAGVKIALSEADAQQGVACPLGVVKGLLPATTYYYVPYAKVGDGYVYGETKSLTTATQQMEYVDMGLSVLWAKCNIGAEAETEVGSLVGYGDATGMMRSTSISDYPSADIAATANDVAFALNIDGDSPMESQMPTQAHFAELMSKTTHEFTTVDGVAGIRFTAANGNSIFMPATGYRQGTESVADACGHYWTGNVSNVNADYSNTLLFDASNVKAGFSSRALGLAVRPVRAYAVVNPDSEKLVFGDIESNGRLRIELYNEYGASKPNPSVDPTSIKFNKNMAVTFTLKGITGNLKADAKGEYIAGLEYADGSWDPSYWSSLTEKGIYEAVVTGDGTYTVWMETTAQAEGAMVFCVDVDGLWADIADTELVEVTVDKIALDADVEQIVNPAPVAFQGKDGGTTDGRIEIYNEYGNGGTLAPQCYNETLKFRGMMMVEFSIAGIDGNLKDGAAGSYNTELSYADADWNPSYWGGAGYGAASVTGDGTYRVWTHLGGDCEGAVVWTIELYGLYQDLTDPTKVTVSIDRVVTPGKN